MYIHILTTTNISSPGVFFFTDAKSGSYLKRIKKKKKIVIIIIFFRGRTSRSYKYYKR